MNLDDISFGPFLLDVRRRQLRCGEVPVLVGRLELNILCVLAEAQGEVVTKDEIFAKVWPDHHREAALSLRTNVRGRAHEDDHPLDLGLVRLAARQWSVLG